MAGHRSVLLEEVVEFLAPKHGDTMLDLTLGYGGHAEKLLERLGPKGRLIGFDKDSAAIENSKSRLEKFGGAVMMVHDDFQNVGGRLKDLGVGAVNGALLDLGVSSPQLDEPERGFSFLKEGPLDMRMDTSAPLTAAQVVNRFPEKELADIIWHLGEERFSRRIARRIVEERARQPIRTTLELASIVSSSVPAAYRHAKIHPATRTFQALRMFVNGELKSLEAVLGQAVQVLSDGARLAVISFHSLEDRMVKQTFRAYQKEGLGRIVTKKPVYPSEEEQRENPRSRSAKLRVFEKVGC